MARAIVRDSKYRHVFGEPSKGTYADLRPTNKSTESCGIRANKKYIVVAWDSGNGSALAPIPIEKTGRLARDTPLLTGHTGPVLDFEFNPFNEDQILSCGEDLTLKLWQIPEGGLKGNSKEFMCDLKGHGKKISFCTFNPVADGIAASVAFDLTMRCWDLAAQEQCFELPIPEQAWSLRWNWQGSLLAMTSKDKMMHVADPRQQKIALSTKIHDGSKGSKVAWIGTNLSGDECNKIITTGFNSQAQRQIMVWDARKFGDASKEEADPLNLLELDNGTGALLPTFDDSTMTLWVAGKGDGNVRYFESVVDDPYLHFVSQYGTSTPQKGFCFAPKKCCDTTKHEIMRGYKMESNTIVPISFKVPRKSEAFQEDIFPDGYAGVPAMGGDAWSTGAAPVNPILCSMKPGAAEVKSGVKAEPRMTMMDMKTSLADALARIEALEKENAALKTELAALKPAAAAP